MTGHAFHGRGLDHPKRKQMPDELEILAGSKLTLAGSARFETVRNLDDAGEATANQDLQENLVPDRPKTNPVDDASAECKETGERI